MQVFEESSQTKRCRSDCPTRIGGGSVAKSVFTTRNQGDYKMGIDRVITREMAKVLTQQSSRKDSAKKAREDGTQRDVPERFIKGKGKSFRLVRAYVWPFLVVAC